MESVNADLILDLINNTVKGHIDADGAMCTAFVLITEWIDSNGKFYSLTVTDEESPGWRHEGLINHALANDIYHEEEGEE